MKGEVDIDLDAVMAQLKEAKDVPPKVLRNALKPWLSSAKEIHLQAADETYSAKAIENAFVERYYRSIDEFCGYINDLKAARNNESHPIYEHYDSVADRAY